MSNRVTNDSANTVSLFPFLAVLLCTMGALLVLLIVLAQRAGERAVAEATVDELAVEEPTDEDVVPTTFQPPPAEDADEALELLRQLEEVREYQRKLAQLRKEGDQRLEEEKERLSHLEAHTRRLELELAELSIAAEQLKATEENQTVDQQQAERELARLEKLIEETETQLEKLREESQGKRSYAIVPYKGQLGTFRKPVYIECHKDGVTLHPEGITLGLADFQATSFAGNPLAAALRATRGYVNAQAAQRGDPEPPDPYPLLLVRPGGIRFYQMARAAITSWGSSFGYEFVDEDSALQFPESPDPVLAEQQEHAIYLARDRMQRLMRSAPRRFQGLGVARSGAASYGGTSADGYGSGAGDASPGGGGAGKNTLADGNGLGNGNSSAAGHLSASGAAGTGNVARGGDHQFGAMAGDGSLHGESDGLDTNGGNSSAGEGDLAGQDSTGSLGPRYGQPGGGSASDGQHGSGGQAGGQAGSGGASGTNAGAAGGSAGGSSQFAGGASGSGGASGGQAASIASSQGSNWAVSQGGRGSVAIRRHIEVVVRENQIALLPSRHATGGEAATGQVVLLDQPLNAVANQLVRALRTRIDEWGLAGSGLYWRPVLKLNVGPGAEQTAQRVLKLMQDSGVEISLPETAQAPQGGATRATR